MYKKLIVLYNRFAKSHGRRRKMEQNDRCVQVGQWQACAAPKDVTACTDNDILAQDIYDREGRRFLSANTSVNGYVKALLNLNGTGRVSVFANDPRDQAHLQKPSPSVQDEIWRIFLILSSGRKVEYERVRNLFASIHLTCECGQSAVIKKLMTEMQRYDLYTYTHSINVSFYSVLIAIFLGLSDLLVEQAAISGLLHDIGKTSIPTEILNKPSALNVEEYALMKRHVTMGYIMLQDNNALNGQIKKAVLLHHERMDGSGYPFGVIPDSTLIRIIAIADVYDAITSDRVYKKRENPFRAFEFFADEGRRAFPREIIGVLLSNFSAMLIGATIRLTSGEMARIAYVPPEYPCRMIVEIDHKYTGLFDLNKICEILPECDCDMHNE